MAEISKIIQIWEHFLKTAIATFFLQLRRKHPGVDQAATEWSVNCKLFLRNSPTAPPRGPPCEWCVSTKAHQGPPLTRLTEMFSAIMVLFIKLSTACPHSVTYIYSNAKLLHYLQIHSFCKYLTPSVHTGVKTP